MGPKSKDESPNKRHTADLTPGKGADEGKDRDRSDAAQVKGCPGGQLPPEARQVGPQNPGGSWNLDLGFWPPAQGENEFLLFKPLCGTSLWQPQETDIGHYTTLLLHMS